MDPYLQFDMPLIVMNYQYANESVTSPSDPWLLFRACLSYFPLETLSFTYIYRLCYSIPPPQPWISRQAPDVHGRWSAETKHSLRSHVPAGRVDKAPPADTDTLLMSLTSSKRPQTTQPTTSSPQCKRKVITRHSNDCLLPQYGAREGQLCGGEALHVIVLESTVANVFTKFWLASTVSIKIIIDFF